MNTECFAVGNMQDTASVEAIERAGGIIRAGGLVIFPTETVYGLGADATNPDAAARIYAAKGRPQDNPLIIHIAEPREAEKYTETNETYYALASSFMPGPLTVILKAKPTIPKTVTAGLDTVAVRCPAHPVANALIRAAGVPIAAPSANLSGKPSPTCFSHVRDDMFGRVDCMIDGGPSDIGVESTIVKIEEDGTLTLLRPGGITLEDFRRIGLSVTVAPAVKGELKPGEKALSPGMKYRHYAPDAPVYLLNGDNKARQTYISREKGKIAYLCYDEENEGLEVPLPGVVLYPIGHAGDTAEQARRLFYILREADKMGFDAIYAPLPEENGMGLALYNRMIRAAAHRIIELTSGE